MKKFIIFSIFLFLVIVIYNYLNPIKNETVEKTKENSSIIDSMKIVSSAFDNGTSIPSKYTCDGDNFNPPLEFNDLPGATKSLVLIVDDPDAPRGTFVHWVVFNIPPTETSVMENSKFTQAVEGSNSSGKTGYIGACPPTGEHRYFFKLYALDIMLALQAGATKGQIETAISGHILESAELMGVYKRH